MRAADALTFRDGGEAEVTEGTGRGRQMIPGAVDVLTSFVEAGKREMSEQALLIAMYEALCIHAGLRPGRYPKLTFRLHEAGLLTKASVDHAEKGHRIDFAWPAKRIGLRVENTSYGYWSDSRPADSALRERGWLILHVDMASGSLDEQVHRVVAVIKRMGPYTGVLL
jgi:hypothetical protein